jgi:sugar/nucleoside kinase (ribokinase family)
MQLARDSGADVILDCGGAETAISQELLPLLSVLSPNETELARLTGNSSIEPYGASRCSCKQGFAACLHIMSASTAMPRHANRHRRTSGSSGT